MTIDVRPWPNDRVKFPRSNVIGEIKPHNSDGIAEGIRQLARRNAARASITPQLLTYVPLDARRTQFQVLAADSGELRSIVAAWRPRQRVPKPKRWYRVGLPISVPAAAEMIPRWRCPTQLGNLLEGKIRQQYATQVGVTLRGKTSASQTGADIEHELLEMAEFLRQLAAELEAEAGY